MLSIHFANRINHQEYFLIPKIICFERVITHLKLDLISSWIDLPEMTHQKKYLLVKGWKSQNKGNLAQRLTLTT